MQFDPYAEWLQIPVERRPPSHYDLLGLPALESDIERIRTATLNRTALVRRYQLSDKVEAVQRLLAELSGAFDCLTHAERKRAYDDELRGRGTLSEVDLAKTSAGGLPGVRSSGEAAVKPRPVLKPETKTPVAQPRAETPAAEQRLPIRRRRRKSNPVFLALGIAALCVGGLIWFAAQPPATQPEGTQQARRPKKSEDLQLPVDVPPPAPAAKLPDSAVAGPPAAATSPAARGDYRRQEFIGELNALGLDVEYLEQVAVLLSGGDAHLYRVSRDHLQTIEYATAAEAAQSAGQLQETLDGIRSWAAGAVNFKLDTNSLNVLSPRLRSAVVLFRKERLVVICGGADAALQQKLAKCLGSPLAEADLRAMSGGGPTGTQSAPNKADAVDLLTMVNVNRDQVAGRWGRDATALISPLSTTCACLELPFDPPAEYVLTLVAERVEGIKSRALAIGLVMQGRPFLVLVNGNDSIGLETVDGKMFHNNVTTHPGGVFPLNTPVTFTCTVRRQGLQVDVDGRRIIDFQGSANRLGLFPAWRIRNRQRLFVGTHCRHRFSRIELTALTGF